MSSASKSQKLIFPVLLDIIATACYFYCTLSSIIFLLIINLISAWVLMLTYLAWQHHAQRAATTGDAFYNASRIVLIPKLCIHNFLRRALSWSRRRSLEQDLTNILQQTTLSPIYFIQNISRNWMTGWVGPVNIK